MKPEDQFKLIDDLYKQLHIQTEETIKFLRKSIKKIEANEKRRKNSK